MLKTLRARLKAVQGEIQTILAKSDASDEELAKLDTLTADVETLTKRINAAVAAEKALADEADADPSVAEEKSVKVPAEPKREPEKFKSFGEQLQAIAQDSMNKGMGRDRRLVFEKVAGANEGIPSEGGFLVQQDFSEALMDLAHDMGQVMSRVRRLPISGRSNSVKLPVVDESSRVDGSRWGGVTADWVDEGETATASKPKFRALELSLKKLVGIGYVTEELLADAGLLQTIMQQAFAEEITFKTEDAIFNGNGVGKPLGILNSGALITVAKEASQAADTFSGWNILKMMARLPVRSMRNAVWYVNQDALPQLWGMVHPANSNVLMYQPPGLSNNVEGNAPIGTLMGRPLIPVEYAATIGDLGDLILADMSQYLMIDKGGVNAATSMHVRFLQDEQTFRITYRVDGQPALNKPVTPKNGTATQSPFVVLEAR